MGWGVDVGAWRASGGCPCLRLFFALLPFDFVLFFVFWALVPFEMILGCASVACRSCVGFVMLCGVCIVLLLYVACLCVCNLVLLICGVVVSVLVCRPAGLLCVFVYV